MININDINRFYRLEIKGNETKEMQTSNNRELSL